MLGNRAKDKSQLWMKAVRITVAGKTYDLYPERIKTTELRVDAVRRRGIGTWPGAVLLQRSGTAYLFANAAHIASVGSLIGGILPLDLRLAGVLRGVPLAVIGPFCRAVPPSASRWRSRPGYGCSP